ncbi:MAG TPA: serine/threonine-protein kinase [Nannocystis sp.]
MEGREAQATALEDTASRPTTLRPSASLANAPTLLGDATVRRQDAPELPIGAEVARYKITGRIGAGGMGVVYRAYDPQLDREIALKLLLVGAEGGTEGRNRMLREAQAAAKIRHPNVVTVYDAGEVGGRVFIAMELIQGSTLKVWLRQPGRTWKDVLSAMLQAGQGLVAAHEVGLVHRDFKPDNVLVGSDGRVHVLDFGLARPALDMVQLPTPLEAPLRPSPAREILLQTLTQTGMAVGTPAYMAPEQHLAQPSSARSDQFSFCVATYEALYGQRPFQGDSYSELSLAVVEGRIVPPPRRTPVPPAVWTALRRGLSPHPDDRYPTLADLLADLEAAMRAASRKPRYGLAAVALLAPVAVLAGMYMQTDPEPPPQKPEAPAVIAPPPEPAEPVPTPALPPPPVAAPTAVALVKTHHVEAEVLHQLLAPIVPESAARLELGSEGLGLAGPDALQWKEPLDQLVQAIDVQRRNLGELARVSTPEGVWAAFEVGAGEGFERKAAAIAKLDDVERTLTSANLGVVVVRGAPEAHDGVARWVRANAEVLTYKEWCWDNPNLKRAECAKTLRECEVNAISWEEGAEAAEAAGRGRPKKKYCYGKP